MLEEMEISVRTAASIMALMVLLFIGGYYNLCDCESDGQDHGVHRMEADHSESVCQHAVESRVGGHCTESPCCGRCLVQEDVALNNAHARLAVDSNVLNEQPVEGGLVSSFHEGSIRIASYEGGDSDFYSTHIMLFTYFPHAPPQMSA